MSFSLFHHIHCSEENRTKIKKMLFCYGWDSQKTVTTDPQSKQKKHFFLLNFSVLTK